MSSVVESVKRIIAWAKTAYADARERWGWLDHLLRTIERYGDRRGNLYAASISFNGILALVPTVMVAFSVAAFVLASQPDLIDQIKDAVVRELPGELGTQVETIIDSAIDSRATVGVVGLLGAAFTGIGWISGVRAAMTEMFGGRVNRNAVMSKAIDLATFVALGIAFAITMGFTTLANGAGLVTKLLSLVNVEESSWAPVAVRIVATLVSVFASWMLFSFMLARLPLVPLPFRNTLQAGLITAIAFEIVKSIGGIYLKSVLSSPAGIAFGPILGVMIFAYLASRIILYATAWCATAPINEPYQVVADDNEEQRPVVVRPTVEVSPMPRPGVLAAAAAAGAALSIATARVWRR